MTVDFVKYHGAGNDFILLDGRKAAFPFLDNPQIVAWLCDRHFGIGADGLILLRQAKGYDFEMVYYNADGREGSMCGNGGRSAVAFACDLGIRHDRYRFLAVDGPHEAVRRPDGWIELHMGDVKEVQTGEDFYFLDTGSPHHVCFTPSAADLDVVGEGRALRYSDRYGQAGANINFVEKTPQGLWVRTYERGVEDETLSCGTGVTASAIAAWLDEGGKGEGASIPITTRGGQLEVRFRQTETGFTDIWLCGPATRVFSGQVAVNPQK